MARNGFSGRYCEEAGMCLFYWAFSVGWGEPESLKMARLARFERATT